MRDGEAQPANFQRGDRVRPTDDPEYDALTETTPLGTVLRVVDRNPDGVGTVLVEWDHIPGAYWYHPHEIEPA